jgi:hypothetical protein
MSEDTDLSAGAELLTFLASAPAEPDELRGQATALAAFRTSMGTSTRPHHRQRPATLVAALSGRVAATLGIGAFSLGGFAAAAYSGTLPGPAQDCAHHTIGAPAAQGQDERQEHPAASSSGTPVGPDATGQASFGLCTAWMSLSDHGQAADQSLALRTLATAAGGHDKIPAYCSNVPHPSATASHDPSVPPTDDPTSRPTQLAPQPSLPSEATSNPGASHRP